MDGLDLGPIVGGGAIGAMVTLFGFIIKAMNATGTRADTRNEAEISRVQQRADDEIVRLARDRDYWRERYLALVEGRPAPTPPPLHQETG